MVCVIVDHSKRSSLLSWFSYERFWIVSAAEVFVVLSGVVLGMVYGSRMVRFGWLSVAKRLCRRALTLYLAFIAVTISILLLSLAGVDVSSVMSWSPNAYWFLHPQMMSAADWRDLAFIRYGPWAFEIVGLYVWLVLAAIPCLLALRFLGWRPLLALSWCVYLWYRMAPHELTGAEFESVFPIFAWQLLFVHGLAIGYHREQLTASVARLPRTVPIAIATACGAFAVLALCNPWSDGPSWLHWQFVSPELFSDLYVRHFTLIDLGLGRLLNLAVALPVGYAMLATSWGIAGRLQPLFVTLGQGSLGAFVLHVYGLVLLDHLPYTDELWFNTLVQVLLIAGIAITLNAIRRFSLGRPLRASTQILPLAA